MPITLFVEAQDIRDGMISISQDETKHAQKVLRKSIGDEVAVVDGEGGYYRAVLESLEKVGGVARVLEKSEEVGESKRKVDLAISPIKNRDRWEFALEKAVELGVHSIIPFASSRTEKVKLNKTRIRAKCIAAIKQCGRSRLPQIHELVDFEDLLELEGYDRKVLCSAYKDQVSIRDLESVERDLLVIGPEGGFSDQEASSDSFTIVSLGERVLRSETAVITALSILLVD